MMMQPQVVQRGILIAMIAIRMISSQPQNNFPIILGGIETVASTATNILSSAVEQPRNLLINATRATTGYIDSAASKGLEFKLRRFLENFRSRMPYGIPDLGIPPMEPLYLEEVDIIIDNREIGNLSIVLRNLTLHSLSTFVVNTAKLSLVGPTIAVNATIPQIQADGLYNISGMLGRSIPLHGSGPFKANINEFQLYVNTMLGFSRGVYLKTFDLDFSLKSVNIKLNNFMGDDDVGRVINKVFEELLPKILETVKPEILPNIKSYIGNRANETIHDLTMRDIINVLLGSNEVREITHILGP
ncbi:uncharacterized protein LOC143426657 isoform X2 [Xylocopa sonorina]|uniref:uncharacterized protein LOC143426657 isoform X2 n=1 Tax=Xylocopa sonorina TaxID=1818115 RepID=UPI00403AB39A